MNVYRHTVAADGEWHTLHLTGMIIHVATRHEHMVELWSIHHDDRPTMKRRLRVYRTGQYVPEGCQIVGSAITPTGMYVWHLIEGCPEDTGEDDGAGCGRIICTFCAPLGPKR